jgi:hypothetical protein
LGGHPFNLLVGDRPLAGAGHLAAMTGVARAGAIRPRAAYPFGVEVRTASPPLESIGQPVEFEALTRKW